MAKGSLTLPLIRFLDKFELKSSKEFILTTKQQKEAIGKLEGLNLGRFLHNTNIAAKSDIKVKFKISEIIFMGLKNLP